MTAIQANPAACSSNPETTSGRSPIRSASFPALGAIRNGATPQGSSRSPAPSGSWPRPACWNWAMKKTAPVIDAFMRKTTMLPAEKPRMANRRIGSIGARARSSQRGERHGRRRARRERPGDLGAGPAGRAAAHQAPHQPERRAGAQRHAGQVQCGARPVTLIQVAQRQRNGEQALSARSARRSTARRCPG